MQKEKSNSKQASSLSQLHSSEEKKGSGMIKDELGAVQMIK